MTPPDTFTTARLFARRPQREDAPTAFAAYASDPDVTRYLPWKTYTDICTLEDYLSMQSQRWDNSEAPARHYLLCLNGTNTPIGSIGMHFDKHQIMFGYVFGKPHWGQGFATEALRHLVDWSLAQPEIYRAWADCDADNTASARVMEKAGMTREGILRRYRIAPNISPEPRDCIMCSKVR